MANIRLMVDLSSELVLSDQELRVISRNDRFVRALRALNFSQLERMIVNALLIDPNPWPILTLEQRTTYTRPAIRAILRDHRAMGLVEECPRRGWQLTPLGRAVFSRTYQEAMAIARGRVHQFSPELLEFVATLNVPDAKRHWHIPSGNVV